MSSQPYISVRKSIKWEGEEAYEDTDTVVLTSAPRGAPFTSSPDKYFVDIRVYHPKLSEPNLPLDKPGQPSSLARLEWGFAGTSKSEPPTFGNNGKLLKPGHSKWTHVVDNRSLSPISDEGFMYPIEGSDETLEKGSMPHPKTGVDTAYEEIWKDVEILKYAREKTYVSWFAEFIPSNSDDLRRGFLCRIGQYVQGVIRIDNNNVEVARWKWAGHDQGGWEKELAIGSSLILNGKLVDPEAPPRQHNKFETLFGGAWQIIQDYYWDDGLELADLKALNSPDTGSKL